MDFQGWQAGTCKQHTHAWLHSDAVGKLTWKHVRWVLGEVSSRGLCVASGRVHAVYVGVLNVVEPGGSAFGVAGIGDAADASGRYPNDLCHGC
jgi:hypothetical protein